jgi:hypothetical protein
VVVIGNKVDEKWVCCDDSEEEDYIKSEVCMVVTDKVGEEELETEGPHEQLGRLNPVFKTFIKMDKQDFEYFYIGMIKFYYYHIPNLEGKEPIDPERDLNFADQYDPYPMMHEQNCCHKEELVVWRKHQLEIIRSMGGDELAEWKKLYHKHVAKKKRKYIEGKKRKMLLWSHWMKNMKKLLLAMLRASQMSLRTTIKRCTTWRTSTLATVELHATWCILMKECMMLGQSRRRLPSEMGNTLKHSKLERKKE